MVDSDNESLELIRYFHLYNVPSLNSVEFNVIRILGMPLIEKSLSYYY